MMILSIILGLLMIVVGSCCLFTPLNTFLSTGYFMSVMLLVHGITGLVFCFKKKESALEIMVNVLAIILGLVSLFLPGTTLVFDSVMIYLTAAWFLVMGIVSIVLAFKARKNEKFWFLRLISGILAVILGIYSFLHPQLIAVSSGLLICLYFIEIGISLIVKGIVVDTTEDNT